MKLGSPPLDDTGTQLLFRLVAAYQRRSLAVASHGPFEQWGRFLPEHTTAASILDRLLHHASVVIPTAPRTVSATPNTSEVIAIQSEEVFDRYMKYLTGCAELFRDGYTDLCQFTLEKG